MAKTRAETIRPSTLNETVIHGYNGPEWYTFENSPNGVSHLYVERDGDGATRLRAPGSLDSPHSVVAKHCARCTGRVKMFLEAALVEYEWVRETVTVTVVRPATHAYPSDSVTNRIAADLGKKKTWQVESIAGKVEPFIAESEVTIIPTDDPMAGGTRQSLAEHDHVHDGDGRCLKNRHGALCVSVPDGSIE